MGRNWRKYLEASLCSAPAQALYQQVDFVSGRVWIFSYRRYFSWQSLKFVHCFFNSNAGTFFIILTIFYSIYVKMLNIIHYNEIIKSFRFKIMYSSFRFLATIDTYKTIGHSSRLGLLPVSGNVEEVCEVKWNWLQPIYISEPTAELWEKNLSGFKDAWKFFNCLGSRE